MSKDLFSRQAADYARYRPDYPAELFNYILQFVKVKDAAWDCATGNGQAAAALAPHFKKVFATDISEKQIALAIQCPNVIYSVAPAEKTSFDDNSFDLVTVAQAYHWLSFDAFSCETKRVAKPGCVIAVWGYNLPATDHDDINRLLVRFYKETVGPYWDKERRYVDEELKTVPFPYEELPAASGIYIQKRWSRDDLAGYLNSWSSVQHYIKANCRDPVEDFRRSLTEIWNDDFILDFRFPVFMRMGRINK